MSPVQSTDPCSPPITRMFWQWVGLCAMACLVFLSSASGQPRMVKLDTLTLDRAISLALENHPSLRAAAASINSASAGVRLALANYMPSISFTGSDSHTEGAFVFNPSIAPRNQIYNTYSATIQAQQTVFDFWRTPSRVSASDDFLEASNLDYQSGRAAVIVNVETAYFGYLQARSLATVNEEALQQAADHLAQAKAFYAVGRRPKFDVTKAEVDLANANVNLIRARNQFQVSKVQLGNAMGIHPIGDYAVSGDINIGPLHMTMDSAKAMALSERPEMLAARMRLEANRSLVTAAWTQHLPTISASAAYTWSAFNFPLYNRWTAGITFSLPIFQGFSIVAQVQQAQANSEAALAAMDVLTESIMLEVEQTYLALKEAEERMAAASKLVDQAEENLQLAQRQYAAGVGTPLDITDAQVTRSNAHIIQIQARYDYNSSLVRLQSAIGALR